MIQAIVPNPIFASIQKYEIAGEWRMVFIWTKAVLHTAGECLYFSQPLCDAMNMNRHFWGTIALTNLKFWGKNLRCVTPQSQDIHFKGILRLSWPSVNIYTIKLDDVVSACDTWNINKKCQIIPLLFTGKMPLRRLHPVFLTLCLRERVDWLQKATGEWETLKFL